MIWQILLPFLFLFTQALSLVQAQVYTFQSSEKPHSGDSILADAFATGKVTNWKAASGHPSLRFSSQQTLAVLKDKEAIALPRVFDPCTVLHLQLQVKLNQASPALLRLVLKNNSGDSFTKTQALKGSAASGWTMVYLHQLLLPQEFSSLELSFQGTDNSLLIQQLEIITECKPVLALSPGIGKVAAADLVSIDSMILSAGDSLSVAANDVRISGEVLLKDGAEVHLRTAPCEIKRTPCVPEKPFIPEPVAFVIYNFITPNGDGLNDVFYIDGLADYPGAELLVLNKAGKIVFHARPYLNDWNGAGENRGLYQYQLRLQSGQKPLSGEVLLEK